MSCLRATCAAGDYAGAMQASVLELEKHLVQGPSLTSGTGAIYYGGGEILPTRSGRRLLDVKRPAALHAPPSPAPGLSTGNYGDLSDPRHATLIAAD